MNEGRMIQTSFLAALLHTKSRQLQMLSEQKDIRYFAIAKKRFE